MIWHFLQVWKRRSTGFGCCHGWSLNEDGAVFGGVDIAMVMDLNLKWQLQREEQATAMSARWWWPAVHKVKSVDKSQQNKIKLKSN
jgi:hypothetical protein